MTYKLDTSKEAAPLYIQIKNHLKEGIHSGKYKVGEKIPSELELCKIYNVSRITVREAINELVNEKYLVRKRAKGTIVLSNSPYQYFTYVKNYTYEMNEPDGKVHTLEADIQKVKADRIVAEKLEVEEGAMVYLLNRKRGMDDKAFVLFKTYLPESVDFSLESNDYYGSLYEMLRSKKIIVSNIEENLLAISPSKEVQQALQVEREVPVLQRNRVTKDPDGKIIEYTECFYLSQEYSYYIEFNATL